MNRLIDQTSPYLLQHAHNPVDWYPWGEEALQKAKAENKPILVSIGYSACHWCHVMERESFEDQTTADLMNRHFINIKIDREERPDVDAIYMDAVQLISGSGGWPLNVFLTPDAKPFYGGTYFPPVQAYNRSSWKDVLLSINQAWHEKPTEIIAQAENLTEHIRNSNRFGNTKPGEEIFTAGHLELITDNLLKNADTVWGGFGKAPKFPQTMSIQFLLRQYHFTGNEAALSHALLSLDKMISGGMYDQLGGGFARYCTDNEWLVPHFEKMLYDNALLVSVISEAYQLTGNPLYRQAIEQTMDFIRQEWQSTEGGIYSAFDADSEGVEGKFYVWSKPAIEEILGADAELFCNFYGVTEHGNWEETNILWVKTPLHLFCKEHHLDEATATASLEAGRKLLLAHRQTRIKPLLDDKILMGWNAMMITAACKAYAALHDTSYLSMAETANGFIVNFLKGSGALFYHNYKKQATNPAFLDDMACYIQALIYLAECTGNNQYLRDAETYTKQVFTDHKDEGSPFFFYTPQWQTDIIIRKKEWYDGATPSGNSIMAWNLIYLSIVFDNADWKALAVEMVRTVAATAVRYPTSFSNWTCLFQQMVQGTNEIVVSGSNSPLMIPGILARFCPNKVLQSQSLPADDFPMLQNKWTEEKTQIFLCRDYACKVPMDSVVTFWEQFGKLP
ncbi:MAG: thioredoxin domain-containing protein [Chitinophagaceae bacterium]